MARTSMWDKPFGRKLKKAAEVARKSQEDCFVVYECGEYAIADQVGLDTYWLGAEIVAVVSPTGEMELA